VREKSEPNVELIFTVLADILSEKYECNVKYEVKLKCDSKADGTEEAI